jgi:hypothetical protein
MGQINYPVKLKKMLQAFGIKNFVETGTGTGSSMDAVLLTEEVEIHYGNELNDKLFAQLMHKYSENENVVLYSGYSEDCMAEILSELNDSPTLFWLDAHFPDVAWGEDGGDYTVGDDQKRLPMETELRIMKENRDLSNDIIIMDDLRIYVDRNYEAGSWEMRSSAGADGYDFVEELIGDTHILIEHHGQQGYLLCFPVNSPEEKIREVTNA